MQEDRGAREGARTLSKLNSYVLDELPVVVCEPSCLSALTDDLPDLIENSALGRRVAEGVMMIDVFLDREIEEGRLERSAIDRAAADGGKQEGRYLIHGHCHQRHAMKVYWLDHRYWA